jgi:hypothetical protein
MPFVPASASVANWLGLLPTPSECGLCVLFILGFVVARSSASGGEDAAALRRKALVCGALGVFAFFWLTQFGVAPDMPDASFTDCLIRDECFTSGAGSSLVFANGAVWPELVTTLQALGVGPAGIFTTVIGMLATGVWLFAWMAWEVVGAALVVPCASVAMALLGAASLSSSLVDCSISFLFSVGAAAALLVYGLSGRAVALVVASVFTAHAVNTHTSAVSLLPAFALLPVLVGPSSWRASLLAGATFLVASAATSSQAMLWNWKLATSPEFFRWLCGGIVSVFVGGVLFRPRYRSWSRRGKAGVVAACLLVPHGVGVLLLLYLRHPIWARYLAPVAAPLSVVITLFLAWPARRLSSPNLQRGTVFLLPMATALFLLGSQTGVRADTWPLAVPWSNAASPWASTDRSQGVRAGVDRTVASERPRRELSRGPVVP